MCAIIGVLNPNKKCVDLNIINNIVKNSADRGVDGFGYISQYKEDIQEYRTLMPSDIIEELQIPHKLDFLIGNTRAEPTTEFIKTKKESDIQPYVYNKTYIVHNGTISNDKELKNTYPFDCPTSIDSYVIAVEFDKIDISNVEEMKHCLTNTLIGSYATLIQKDGYLIAASNYKPLYILNKNGVYYFASLPTYFGVDDSIEQLDVKILEIKPYTALQFNMETGNIVEFSLYKNLPNKKAVICASSGLDSTVAISWAKKNNYDVTLLHFNYDCQATEKELGAINNIASFFNVPVYTINANFFKNIIGGSNLYGDAVTINKNNEAGAELAIEWVPARNLIFLSIAAGFCEAKNIDFLILGGNLEESGAYSDNEYIFLKKFNDLLPNALNLQRHVQILTPLANLMKRDIVKLGIELDSPLHLTWSCYDNGNKHCGQCGPCFMRRTAFKMLNQPEVIEYEH